MKIEDVRAKYAADSLGAFGNLKNPKEKTRKRERENNPEYGANRFNASIKGSRYQNAKDALQKTYDALFNLESVVQGDVGFKAAVKKIRQSLGTFKALLDQKGKGSL